MVSSWLGILAVACRRENGKEPVFSNTSYTRPSRGFECTQSERQIFQQVTLNRDFFVGLMRLLPHSHSCIENVNCPASRELWDFFFFLKLDIRVKLWFLIGFFIFFYYTLDFIWISSVFLLMFLLVFDRFSIFTFFLNPYSPKTSMALRSTGHLSCRMSQIWICLILFFPRLG